MVPCQKSRIERDVECAAWCHELRRFDEMRARLHVGAREVVHVVTIDDRLRGADDFPLLMRLLVAIDNPERSDSLELAIEQPVQRRLFVRAGGKSPDN